MGYYGAVIGYYGTLWGNFWISWDPIVQLWDVMGPSGAFMGCYGTSRVVMLCYGAIF